MPAWDPIVNLDPSSIADPIGGPIFDSSGNAWVVINDAINLVAVQSNGTSGTWQAPHVIGPTLEVYASVGVAVDQTGGFYVTYGTGLEGGGSSSLMWTKYTPTAGWQAAAQIYSSSSPFGETFPEIDSAGRLVVVFNSNGISSLASNPTQTSWGAVQTISPATADPILPSVAANTSGTRLALVYLSVTGLQKGLRYTLFNSTTGKWNNLTAVPNSANATFSGYSTLNAYPMAVDASGNITLAAPLLVKSRADSAAITRPTTQWSIGGFRYENGVWSMQQLTPLSASLPSLESFGSTALNANGAVLISVPLSDGFEGVNMTVFRYTPGVGWDTEIAAFYDNSSASRCKVAWFEGTEAVLVYDAAGPLLAALYAIGAWGSAPPIPGNFMNVNAPALAAAPTGEDLLGVPQSGGVYVTYLRP
jgi:hypothetical protein